MSECLYSSGVAEPDRSAAQWIIFRHWVAIFILQKYSSVSCWQAISFINVSHRPDFVLCLILFPTFFFSLWFVVTTLWTRRMLFYFGSCIRYFSSQIFSITQFIHLSAAAYTSLLIVFYGKLLQITELKGGKEKCVHCRLSSWVHSVFGSPFSKYVVLCVYACVFPCLTQLGTDIVLYEQWLHKGLGVTICGRQPTGLHWK